MIVPSIKCWKLTFFKENNFAVDNYTLMQNSESRWDARTTTETKLITYIAT